MKKIILLILLINLFLYKCESQNILNDWLIQSDLGIEKHDKRLFKYSEREGLLDKQPELWGTYHLGLTVNRRIKQLGKFHIFTGLGLNFENATFIRPFDHLLFKKDFHKVLWTTKNYKKLLMPLSFLVYYKVTPHLFFNIEVKPSLLIYRRIEVSKKKYYANTPFNIESLEMNVGLNYLHKHFIFGINSRLLNYQKIDKILFNRILKDPRIDQIWEFYNPLRLNISIGYTW